MKKLNMTLAPAGKACLMQPTAGARIVRHLHEYHIPSSPHYDHTALSAHRAYCLLREFCPHVSGEELIAALYEAIPELFADYWLATLRQKGAAL